MPDRQIINLPGQPHFVTFSTYQRRRFLSPDRTRSIVLEVLQGCLKTHEALCHGFVIMPDHVHAVLTTHVDSTISSFLHAWKKASSYRIKRFYEQQLTHYQDMCPKNSPLWQANFYDFNLETEDKLNEKLDYMHNNPVTAKIALNPAEWIWSSARFYDFGEDVGVTVTPSR